MELPIQEELAAQAIGAEALKYLKEAWTLQRLALETEQRALKALEDVRRVLDDDALDDPECFRRMEAVLSALEKNGIYSTRHDW